ncbi:response regulator transcription factor [Candidatus Peregrinibacteria bacterium]|nr:MAG: response regulator transcription factor [Candidatus Peregrinibacteria bacterium]
MNPKKILIIEDNEDLVELYKTAFSAEGFDVRSKGNGMDGIVQAPEFRPDVILLDIMMPQMDGFEVLSAIRNNSSMNVFIAINSNLSRQQDIDLAKRLGANVYLQKSEYGPTELVEKIQSLLKGEVQEENPLSVCGEACSPLLPPEVQQFFLIQRMEESDNTTILHVEEKNIPLLLHGQTLSFQNFLPIKKMQGGSVFGRNLLLLVQSRQWVSPSGDTILTRRIVSLPSGGLSVAVVPV